MQAQTTVLQFYYYTPPSEFTTIPKNDSIVTIIAIQKKITAFNTLGYLIANCDSIKTKKDTVIAYINKGPAFEWASIKWSKTTNRSISNAILNNTPKGFVNTETYNNYMQTVLNDCSNKGYPFAKISIDSFAIEAQKLSAVLKLEVNQYYKIDSIVLDGKPIISKNFIEKYLDIKEGMPYNDTKFEGIQKKLDQLNFLQQAFPYYTSFSQTECKLLFFFKKQRTSRFDAIVGFLPSPNNKTIFTGDLSLKLVNELRNAESIDLSWRRLQDQTQDLFAGVSVPFIFSLPFGLGYNIKIYRRDTTFNDVQQEFAVNYKSNFNNTIKLFFRKQNTSNISAKNIFNTTDLLQSADINAFSYGLAWLFENTDFKFNPRKGFQILLKGSAGTRKVLKNSTLPESLYTGVRLNTSKIILESDISYFIPIRSTQTLKLQMKSASIQAPELFINESYRIGGLKSMRGINEESVFANAFSIATIEYRYLFSKYSNIFGFADAAWYENKLKDKYIKDQPYSFGAGINLETKAGIFSLAYAIAKQFNNPIDFSAGKIHFGLTGVF
jgi:Omp85 superfamily domain